MKEHRIYRLVGIFILEAVLTVLLTSCEKSKSIPTNPDTVSPTYPVYSTINDIVFVTVPCGSFRMGDIQGDGYPEERPVHTVNLDAFKMSIFEITNVQYVVYLNEALKAGIITAAYHSVRGAVGEYCGEEYLNVNDYFCKIRYNGELFEVELAGMEYHPVTSVTWYGAKAFARYHNCDLPTEAEWEYACRAGTTTRFYTGNDLSSDRKISTDLDRAGWYYDNCYKDTDKPCHHPVGQKEPNAFGLYDMHGNVFEWCHDRYYGEYYNNSPVYNPSGPPEKGTYKVFRGGSWKNNADFSRSSRRIFKKPEGNQEGSVGFRIVRRQSGKTY